MKCAVSAMSSRWHLQTTIIDTLSTHHLETGQLNSRDVELAGLRKRGFNAAGAYQMELVHVNPMQDTSVGGKAVRTHARLKDPEQSVSEGMLIVSSGFGSTGWVTSTGACLYGALRQIPVRMDEWHVGCGSKRTARQPLEAAQIP